MGKVLAYTEPERPGPVPTGPRPASSTEEDMTAVGLPQRMHLPGLLKVEQASALMGISRSAAYRAVAAGDLPSVRFGCRLYVPTARLLELLGLVPEGRCGQGLGVLSVCPVGEVGPGGMELVWSRHELPGSCGSHSLMTTVEARACRAIILDPIRPDRTAPR